MKRVLIFLILIILITPCIVLAKENIYTVNLYEYDTLSTISQKDKLAIQAALELGHLNYEANPVGDQYDITIKSILTNKTIFTGRCYDFNFNCSSYQEYFNTLTLDDTIEFDTVPLSSYGDYFEELLGHDKIIINFSNKPSNRVFISSYSLVEKTPNTTTSNEKIQDLKIDFDLKFTKLNDYALYKFIIKNTTDKDFQIENKTKYGKDNIVKYEFSFNDNNIIKKHSQKEMYIKISYNNYVETASLNNKKYSEDISITIPLTNNEKSITNPLTTNPLTNRNMLIIIIFIVIVTTLIKLSIPKKKKIMIITLLLLIPISIKAIDKITININSKVEIINIHKFCIDSDNNCYEFDEGMTWEEWLNSEYNKDFFNYEQDFGFIYTEESSFECGGPYISMNIKAIFDLDNNSVKKTDIIKNQYTYKTAWKSWSHNSITGTNKEVFDGETMC